MNSDKELEDIVNQLKRLQIQQTELITRLEQLNEVKRSAKQESDAKPAPTIARRTTFAVGDQVRIRNPGILQANTGRIVKINTDTHRITIQTKNGNKIVRATKNVSFE